MTYYGGKELAAAFRTVRNNTLTMAEEIPEGDYAFKPSGESRSIGGTFSHIALIPVIALHIHGNKVDDLMKVPFFDLMKGMIADEAKPRTKSETIAFLKAEGDTFEAYLAGLSEDFLAEQVKMPPNDARTTKSRFEMLLGVKEHEMHHRAQLMVMQRMIGQVPHLTRQMQARMAQATAAPIPTP